MKKLLVLMFMAVAWLGGYGYGRWYAKPPAGERKPLYWVEELRRSLPSWASSSR